MSRTALKERIAVELQTVRHRSLGLLDPLPLEEQVRQHSTIMSPLVWDLGHVGNYEELWLLRSLGGQAVGTQYDDMYDSFSHPRPERPSLPLLGPSEARAYIGEVRDHVLDRLDGIELDGDSALIHGGFVYGMVVQHEHQHDETMLQTLNLMGGGGYARYAPIATPPPGPAPPLPALEVYVEGGPFPMGTSDEPWAYDNERAEHIADVAAFWIDAVPVSNGQYARFVEEGGYHDATLWDERGWRWRLQSGTEYPLGWERDGRSWSVSRFGLREPIRPEEPVQHVCWYEADAYARWTGKRLPSEAEWEKAASWDAAPARKRRYPWGDEDPDASLTNLGQRHFGPAPVGAYPDGESPFGCRQMVGDVWEWTSSDFLPYPGFVAFPYREYSEVFFGPRYKVLRGGSWATHPTAIRNTFRNWDLPIRRQIFAGFRCARDA